MWGHGGKTASATRKMPSPDTSTSDLKYYCTLHCQLPFPISTMDPVHTPPEPKIQLSKGHSFILLAEFKGTLNRTHPKSNPLTAPAFPIETASCYLSVSQAKVLGMVFDSSVPTHILSPGLPVNPPQIVFRIPHFTSSTPTSGPSLCVSAFCCPLNTEASRVLSKWKSWLLLDTQGQGCPYPPLHGYHLALISELR